MAGKTGTFRNIQFIGEEGRLKLITELKNNESRYYENLESAVKIYQTLLQRAEEDIPELSKRAVKEVFLNVDQLLPIHKHLLDGIIQRIDLWGEIQLFGDIFLKMAPFLKGYPMYCEYYLKAQEALTRIMNIPTFTAALNVLLQEHNAQSLETLLELPFSRIQKYVLMLTELLKRTDPGNPDYQNVSDAIITLEELVKVEPLPPTPQLVPKPQAQSPKQTQQQQTSLRNNPQNQMRPQSQLGNNTLKNQSGNIQQGVKQPGQGTLRSQQMNQQMGQQMGQQGTLRSQQMGQQMGQGTMRTQSVMNPNLPRQSQVGLQGQGLNTLRGGGSQMMNPQLVPQRQRQLIAEGIINVKSKEEREQSGGIKMFNFGSKTQKDLLQIWLFTDVLVHVKTSKSKKRQNIQAIEYTWPLELIWVQDIDKLDNSDPKLAYTFRMTGPKKSYILRFPDSSEKNLWLKRIQEAISKILNIGNAPDDERRYGKYKFQGGNGEYEGWWKNGKLDGEGVYVFFGNKFTGKWEENCKSGVGTLEFVSGEVYHGDWLNNVPHGFGQLQYTNGDRYEGEWKEGQRSGLGVLSYSHGDSYTGEWLLNAPHGEGTYRTATGFLYTGGFVNGKFHGHGTLLAPNGRCYEGEFKNGMKHGEGKLDYSNGDFYIGQWKEDKRHGYGVSHSPVEGIYEGNYQLDKKEGLGIMQYRSGDVYEGNWKRDVFHGAGTLFSLTGGMDKFEGNFEMGKMSGKGTIHYRDRSRYEGHIQDDILHGTGVHVSANAIVFDGKWEDGRRNGRATLSVGPSKFPSNCKNGMMCENEKSFLVNPDVPLVHFEL